MMTTLHHLVSSRLPQLGVVCAGLLLAGCGGGASPLGNPPQVENPAVATGRKLSFVYFQKCINPIFLAQLEVNLNGASTTNTCASSGCHDTVSGTGGALRIVGAAPAVDLGNAANTPDVVRASDMYKNYYSAQGATVPGVPDESRLLAKPLLRGVLHGGGLIFESEQNANARLIRYWITHPIPETQDEFGSAANGMFTPADAATGTCNTD